MALGPIDYTSAQAGLQDQLKSLQGGLQVGAGIEQLQAQQQAQDAARQRAVQYQADVSAAAASQSPQAFSALALKYPEQREAVKQAWDGLSAADQKAEGDTMAQAYAALLSGDVGAAKDVVQNTITARKNSNLDTSHFDSALKLLDADPSKAQAALGFTLSHIGDPKDFAAKFGALQGEQRAQDLAPAAVRSANAKAGEAETDAAQKVTAAIGSAAGSLVGKKASVDQVKTMFMSQAKKGLISAAEAKAYSDAIPQDATVRDQWLGTFQMQGVKPEDQVKLTTPDANAKLSAETSRYATNVAAGTAAARLKFDKDQAAAGDDTASFTPDAVDNAAARYNVDGTLPPMGLGAAAAAGRTKILNRAAELKKGIDPEQQRRDQLANKGQIKNQTAAIAAFNQGKQGNAIRSFNVLLDHLDTLGGLSEALNNGNTQIINRLGNAYGKATGAAAPTNFEAVKHIVGDEAVKAIVGTAGALGDREAIAATINGANSPAQLKGVIDNIKKLAVGQLGGLETQYQTSTGLNDFEHLLSPSARLMREQHKPKTATAPAPALPGGWTVKEH